MFPDYIKRVLLDYEKKRDANKLPLGLVQPAPARLKEACERVCRWRYEKRDEKALQDFFGKGVDQAGFLEAISQLPVDKFKPLVKFLRGQTDETHFKNIELLAWLIDFQQRPWVMGWQYKEGESVDPVGMEGLVDTDAPVTIEGPVESVGRPEVETETEIEVEATVRRPFRRWNVLVGVLLVAGLGLGGYLIFGGRPIVIGPQRCMYWAEDHFEQVDCGKRMEGVQVIALDPERLVRFRKITRQDTITYQSIGHVWYVRVNGGYEYYTSDGAYPTDPRVSLRPLTAYIIRNHLAGGMVEGAGH